MILPIFEEVKSSDQEADNNEPPRWQYHDERRVIPAPQHLPAKNCATAKQLPDDSHECHSTGKSRAHAESVNGARQNLLALHRRSLQPY